MTITTKYTPATSQSRPVQRYQRPAIITAEQFVMVLLTMFVACYLFDWYGLLIGAAMTILLLVSNIQLCGMIADIEQEEREEGQR